MTRMLLVSHEASLTGAPRVAAEILRATLGVVEERIILARWPGPRWPEMVDEADWSRLEPLRRTRVVLRRFRRTRLAAVHLEEAVARRVLRREKPDLVYLNTVKSACYVRPALELGCRVIIHSHELNPLASDTLARYRLAGLYSRVRLVACSRAAGEDLRMTTGIEDVTVVPSTVDAVRVRTLAAAGTEVENRWTSDHGVVLACGTADSGKGTDLWLEMVRLLKDRLAERCPIFVWVGSCTPGNYEHLARDLGVEDRVLFPGPTLNPYPAIAGADILTVPSRQDAFPLVVLEAMVLGTPVVAFDVGGVRDQLGETGVVVAPNDTMSMADSIVRLLADEGLRSRLTAAATQRVEDLYGIGRFRREVATVVRAEMEART